MPWPTENTLLATIAHEDRRRLERHLEPVLLPIRKKLEVAKKPIEYVYFPESGIASVVSHVNNDRQIEVGVIGREGMTGLAALCYHHGPVQNEVYMQVAGTGFQLSVATSKRHSPQVDQSMRLCLDSLIHFICRPRRPRSRMGTSQLKNGLRDGY